LLAAAAALSLTARPTMSVLQEFKQFAIKGNVIDLAVGVLIGGAFGKIVESLVGDILMPVIGGLFGTLDFSNLFIVLGKNPGDLATLAELKKAGVAVFAYGNFITVAVNFFILAFIIFVMVQQINRLKRTKAPEVAPTAEDILLLREIRDAVKASAAR
jgi:large conductance mechanosensitive channel